MLVSAANQSHTCKALLQATAHGARTTGFVLLAPMLVSSFQGMGVTMGKVPWGSMLGFMFVSSFEGMREVAMGKVLWGSMLASMLASMLVSRCQGMGEVTMGKVQGGSWFPDFTVWAKLKGVPC